MSRELLSMEKMEKKSTDASNVYHASVCSAADYQQITEGNNMLHNRSK